jgi:ribonuclease.
LRRWGWAWLAAAFISSIALAAPCRDEVHRVNSSLRPIIDEVELTNILNRLNATHNLYLPDKFVTKRAAIAAGWQRGHALWDAPLLKGKSIGGDRFGNRERQLPAGQWREADLDYKGGHRGAKRLIFSLQGRRFVTVDHYQTYTEIPACQ